MTREEVLLEALAASQAREREMAERVIEMEEKLEGFEPDGDVSALGAEIEERLRRVGSSSAAFGIESVTVKRRLGGAAEMCIVARERTLPAWTPMTAPQMQGAIDALVDAMRKTSLTYGTASKRIAALSRSKIAYAQDRPITYGPREDT